MVEIKHDPEEATSNSDAQDDAKYRLIYAKSKVYVNPTAYARDNIPGFAALVRKVRSTRYLHTRARPNRGSLQEAFTSSYLLAWIPESLLSEKGETEWAKFLRMEDRPVLDESEVEGVWPLVHVEFTSLTPQCRRCPN